MAEYLTILNACSDAIKWVGDKTFAEAWATCERGDWMLWLAQKANLCDHRTLTLMKGMCANTARDQMRYPYSIAAIDAAIDYGRGEIGEQELADAAANAADAWSYFPYAAYAAAHASASADYAVPARAYASAAETANNLRQCADICREILPNPTMHI